MPKFYAMLLVLFVSQFTHAATGFNCTGKDRGGNNVQAQLTFSAESGKAHFQLAEGAYVDYNADVTYKTVGSELFVTWVYGDAKDMPLFRLEAQGYCDDMSDACSVSGYTAHVLWGDWINYNLTCTQT